LRIEETGAGIGGFPADLCGIVRRFSEAPDGFTYRFIAIPVRESPQAFSEIAGPRHALRRICLLTAIEGDRQFRTCISRMLRHAGRVTRPSDQIPYALTALGWSAFF
jgi:hypothetical protein